MARRPPHAVTDRLDPVYRTLRPTESVLPDIRYMSLWDTFGSPVPPPDAQETKAPHFWSVSSPRPACGRGESRKVAPHRSGLGIAHGSR